MVHHRRGLRRLLRDDALLTKIESDWQSAPLDERRRAIVTYAAKLTLTPSECCREDVAALATAGLADEDTLALAEVVAYYAYVNRIADGLGVAVEGEEPA